MEKYNNIIVVFVLAILVGLGCFLSKKGLFSSWFAKLSKSNELGEANNKEREATVNVESNANSLDLSANSKPAFCKWNNPLNIRKTNEQWQGKVKNPTQNNFEEFEDLDFGTRAGVKNLITYNNRGWNTVQKIVEKWAPSSDGNNTSQYVANVAKRIGANKDAVLNLKDKNIMAKLVTAMSISEKASGEHLTYGYTLGVINRFGLL